MSATIDLAGPPQIRVYREDCLRGMSERLEPGSIDVVVTSPPYNIGVRYSAYHDRLPRDAYLTWIADVGRAAARALGGDGSFFLNVGGAPSDPWTAFDVAQALRSTFELQNVIHWVKSIAISRSDARRNPNLLGDIAVGHYKPTPGSRFLHDCHEYVFHFTKTGRVTLDRRAVGVPYQDKSNIGRWGHATADVRCRGNTWFVPYKTIRDRRTQRPHPATFPVELAEMCVRLHGVSRTRRVLDPFMGIGSTALACLRLGVACEGFEIDAGYLETARERLAREAAVAPLL